MYAPSSSTLQRKKLGSGAVRNSQGLAIGAGDRLWPVGSYGHGDQEVSDGSVPQVSREARGTLQASGQLHQDGAGGVGLNEGLPR